MLERYLCAVAALVALQAMPARAAGEDGYPFFGGFAIGLAGADEECDYYGYDCDGEDFSFKFFAGKRLHENLALEISFQDLGKLDNEEGAVDITAESSGINLSLVAIIPTGNAGYLFGKIGAIAWQADYRRFESGSSTSSEDDGTDFTYGAGFAWQFDEKYELRFEFERLHELGDEFTLGGAYASNFTIGGVIQFN